MSSRRLEDLTPEMELLARRFIKECEAEDFDVLIYCTYRSPEEQAVEYCKGRNQDDIKGGIDKLISLGMDDMAKILGEAIPNKRARESTKAPPGLSCHQHGLAFDGCPMVNGRCLWDTKAKSSQRLWARYGLIAENCGLNWSGYWTSFREYPHCQMRGELMELIKPK